MRALRVPQVLQSEAAECGLACLAMIAAAHGNEVSLASLRRRFALSLKGMRLDQLIDCAGRLGLSARPLRLELKDIRQLRLPCILHWDLNHFVVLRRVSSRRCEILDPAVGARELSWRELSPHFTGVAVELTPERGFIRARAEPPLRLRELLVSVGGLWPALGRVLLLSLSLQCCVVLSPFLLQWVIDQSLVAADRELLPVLGLGFVLLALLQAATALLRGSAVLQLATQLGSQWLSNVVAHLLRLPLDFFAKRHLGDINSRLGSLQSIQRTLTTSSVESLIDGVLTVLTLALMCAYSLPLAATTLALVVSYLALRLASFRALRDSSAAQLGAAARQQSHLLESLRGMQSIKVAGREAARRAAFDNLLAETVHREVTTGALGVRLASAQQLLFGVERVVVICFGAELVLAQELSVGMLMAYLAYKDQFAARAGALIEKLTEMRMLGLHMERLADIVCAEPENSPAADCALPLLGSGDIWGVEVSGLSFRYGSDEPWALRDCNFVVRAGESVAIVGGSGAGKTTLLKLLLGLLTPNSGTVRIGGLDVVRGGAAAARAGIGAVMQDDQLFAGCIADNISFFAAEADLARIEHAARLAAVHEDIAAMPMAYNSLIGDMGNALSGGQKQRLLLARALYREPKLLILDEATSHLDIDRERRVSDAVRALKITRIIVAHRPETIASADRVLLLDAGGLREIAPPTLARRAIGP